LFNFFFHPFIYPGGPEKIIAPLEKTVPPHEKIDRPQPKTDPPQRKTVAPCVGAIFYQA
jgi:hypothetical protein